MSISEYEPASENQIKRCVVDAVGGDNNPKFQTTEEFASALQALGFECEHRAGFCRLNYRTRSYGIYLFSKDKKQRQDEMYDIRMRIDGNSIKAIDVSEEAAIDESGSITGLHQTDDSVPHGPSSDDILGPLTKQHSPSSQRL